MVTLVTPPSPTSIQLRWGLRCRNSTLVPLRVRFWKSGLDRSGRSVLVRCVGDQSGEERHSSSSPKVSPVDSFSGWFEEDSDGDGDGDGGSGEKKGYGGIFGAGLAGMFLTASVAFASISLSSKRTIACAGMKQSMKPLTSQQEVLLCSDDDQNDKASLIEEKSNVELPNCHVEIPKSGTLEDSISEPSISVQQTEFHQVNSSPSEDLPEDPDSKYSSSESPLPNSNVLTNLKELSSYTADSADLNSGHQEESLPPSELENSKVSNQVDSQLSSETLDIDTCFDLEPSATLDTQPSNDLSKVDTDLGVTHELENDKIDKIPTGTISTMDEKEVVLVKETISSSLDQSSPSGIGLSEAPYHSVFVNQYNKESESDKLVETISSWSPSDSIAHIGSFSHAGIPAPSVVSSALQVPLGKVLVPAVIDQIQGHAFSALQVLKVIEGDVQPGDICTRREYVRWLVSASGAHSRNTISKVYPAMYIENMTELAFDDITPEDPDFSYIQGLAEAGLISSKLTCSDTNDVKVDEIDAVLFSPESPLSRQDLVCWKMALERRHLPEVDRKMFHQHSGYIDIDKISTDAWPAIVADLSSGENGIISLAFGYTRLFQPKKPVTNAQAAIALSTGDLAEVVGEELTRIEAESLAETAVAAHTALVADVAKDLNTSFEKELAIKREKIDAIEKLAEEATSELKILRAERDEEYNSLIRGRAAVESEMEVFSRLRNELEEQLQNLISNKTEIAFERDRINKLRMEAENENQTITQLQYELEVERKALSMARAWAEDEAKKAREQGKALEKARERWERHGIKVMVDDELRESASDNVAFLDAGKQNPVEVAADKPENILEKFKSRSQNIFEELKDRAEKLVEKLKALALQVKGKSSDVIQRIIQKILAIVSTLKLQFSEASQNVTEKQTVLISKANQSMQEFKDKSSAFSLDVKDGARKTVEDFKETLEKITKRSKTT